MDYSLAGSSVHGILQAEILEWVVMPFLQGIFLTQGQTHVSCVSCTGRRILYHWEAPKYHHPGITFSGNGFGGRQVFSHSNLPSLIHLSLSIKTITVNIDWASFIFQAFYQALCIHPLIIKTALYISYAHHMQEKKRSWFNFQLIVLDKTPI